jgi:hypothetical protein
MSTASARLSSDAPWVDEVSTSNQASVASRVAVTRAETMAMCRRRHPAHAVVASPMSRARSKPTQAPRQWLAT